MDGSAASGPMWGISMQDVPTPGLLVVLSAPSGAGKTSVLADLFKRYPSIQFSVSATTRAPRKGERDGVDYHFVTDERFDEYIRRDAFAEWAVVHGKRYGTLKRTVEDAHESGTVLLLDTDTVGAENIKHHFPDAILIFLVPPSPAVLRGRLSKRNTETPESVRSRFEAAPGELSRIGQYDYIVINDRIENAVEGIGAVITAELSRCGRVMPQLTEWRDFINGS